MKNSQGNEIFKDFKGVLAVSPRMKGKISANCH